MTTTYRVEWTITVDRPSFRGPSFSPVAAGYRVAQVETHSTYNGAIRAFNALLSGQWDFASEFVSAAAVVSPRHNRSPRVIRRRVTRQRPSLAPASLAALGATLRPQDALHHAAYLAGRTYRTIYGGPSHDGTWD